MPFYHGHKKSNGKIKLPKFPPGEKLQQYLLPVKTPQLARKTLGSSCITPDCDKLTLFISVERLRAQDAVLGRTWALLLLMPWKLPVF